MSAVAPDGSPVALWLALKGDDEAALIDAAVPAGAAILELGSGPGRVTRPLLGLGHAMTCVDNSAEMLGHLPSAAEAVLVEISELDLSPRRWPVVLLASHLVNGEDGAAFLAVAARHLERGGCVIVQRFEPGWVDTVEPAEGERDGVRIGVTAVRHPAHGTLEATMVFGVGGETYEQPFTAYEIDIDGMAANAGLRVDAVLDDEQRWIRLVAA